MIQPNELRIGNFVFVNRGKNKTAEAVHAISKGYIDGLVAFEGDIKFNHLYHPILDWHNTNEIDPIPLTDEILLELGANKVNHITGYSFFSFSKSRKNKFNLDIYESRTLYNGYSIKRCQYLHQLQNLYFSLTGKELDITLQVTL